MKRSIWFWMYFVIAVILAIYFATRITMIYTGRSNMSYITHMTIKTDSANKDFLNPIAAAVAVSSGTRPFGKTLTEINTRASATPGVRFSATSRLPNNDLEIYVELYDTIAQWTDGLQYYPLAPDGTIINKPSDTRLANTVVFRGSVPVDIGAITTAAQTMLYDLDYMEFIEDRRWNLHTLGGITVMLPETDPTSAIARLKVLDKNHQILSKDITVLDMRDDARILVK